MEPYIGEIRIFAGNYAPMGWAFCNGQVLPIAQNTALFSVLGTTYGGDGKTTFALPNLCGKAAMHQGAGPGLTPRKAGDTGGAATVSLNNNHLPAHNHMANCQTTPTSNTPDGTIWSNTVGRGSPPMYNNMPNAPMNPQAVQAAGGSDAHNNMQPYLGLNFIIALQGLYPPKD